MRAIYDIMSAYWELNLMFHCLLWGGWVQQEDSSVTKTNVGLYGLSSERTWSCYWVTSSLQLGLSILYLASLAQSQMMWKTFASSFYVLSSATRPLQVTPLWWLWARSRRRHSVQTDCPSRQDASKVPCSTPPLPYQVTCAAFPYFLITHRSQYLIMNTAQGGDAVPLIAWQLRRAGYQKCCDCDIALLV